MRLLNQQSCKSTVKNGGFDLEGILKEVNSDTSLVWVILIILQVHIFSHDELESFWNVFQVMCQS